jgi:hypothetical protein
MLANSIVSDRITSAHPDFFEELIVFRKRRSKYAGGNVPGGAKGWVEFTCKQRVIIASPAYFQFFGIKTFVIKKCVLAGVGIFHRFENQRSFDRQVLRQRKVQIGADRCVKAVDLGIIVIGIKGPVIFNFKQDQSVKRRGKLFRMGLSGQAGKSRQNGCKN